MAEWYSGRVRQASCLTEPMAITILSNGFISKQAVENSPCIAEAPSVTYCLSYFANPKPNRGPSAGDDRPLRGVCNIISLTPCIKGGVPGHARLSEFLQDGLEPTEGKDSVETTAVVDGKERTRTGLSNHVLTVGGLQKAQ